MARPADAYGAPYPMTRRLFEDGRAHRLFGGEIRTFCPVFILQGMADPDVPWRHAMSWSNISPPTPRPSRLIKDGEHRLSRPQDLTALQKAIAFLDEAVTPAA